MKITEQIKKFVENETLIHDEGYHKEWLDHLDSVSVNAVELAEKLNADKEVVFLAAWLHDIGTIIHRKEDHHITGAEIVEEKLRGFGYPEDKIKQVKHCVFSHRASRNIKRETVEAQIIADADSMAHFGDIEGLEKAEIVLGKFSGVEVDKRIKEKLIRSWGRLSSEGKKFVEIKYPKVLREIKMKIGIDIDDVLVNFMENFLKHSNLKNKTFFNVSDVKNYHLWETGIHDSKEESVKAVAEFLNSKSFDELNLIEGVKEILEKISEIYDIYFITSRPEDIKDKTENFLRKNFPKNNFKVIYSGEIHGGKSKAEICSDFGIPFMVEDNAVYALDCARKGVKVFLLEKPWNKNHEEHPNIIKINHLKEVLREIK